MNPRPWDLTGSPACEAGVRTAELPALSASHGVEYLISETPTKRKITIVHEENDAAHFAAENHSLVSKEPFVSPFVAPE